MNILARVQNLVADVLTQKFVEQYTEELVSERLLNNELQRALTKLHEECSALQTLNGDLLAEHGKLAQERDRLKLEHSATEQALHNCQEQLSAAHNGERYKSLYDELLESKRKLDAKLGTVERDYRLLREAHDQLTAERNDLKEAVRVRENDFNQMRQERDTLRKMREAEEQAVFKCQKEVERLELEVKQLTALTTVEAVKDFRTAKTRDEERLLDKNTPIDHDMALRVKALLDKSRRDLDFYAKAWIRELEKACPIVNKMHEIDALVITTERVVEERRKAMLRVTQLELALTDAQREAKDAWSNRDRFCSAINVIGHEVLGFTGDNCAEDAVVRETKALVQRLRTKQTDLEGEAARLTQQLGQLQDVKDVRDRLVQEKQELTADRDLWRSLTEKLSRFKEYVHDRLDKAGVPKDPEPEENAKHGCRIEGRLNWALEEKFNGSVLQRWTLLTQALQERFPHPAPHDSSEVAEAHYLRAVDAHRHAVEVVVQTLGGHGDTAMLSAVYAAVDLGPESRRRK